MLNFLKLLLLGAVFRLTNPESNHTAGVVFIAEDLTILPEAYESIWLTLPYPEALPFNESLLRSAHDDFRTGLAEQWKDYGGNICADGQLTERVLNLTQHYVEDVAEVARQINSMLKHLKETTASTVNHDQAHQSRSKRWVLPLLAGIGTALVLAPVLKDEFCHLTTSLGFCGETKHMRQLQKENRQLNEQLKSVTLATGERLHLIASSLNRTQHQLQRTTQGSNENFRRIQAALNQLLDHTHTKTGNDYCVSVKPHTLYTDLWALSLSASNFSSELYDIREELITYRASLTEVVHQWHRAINELTEGNLASDLVTPGTWKKVLANTDYRRGKPVIPPNSLNLYYRLELVEASWAAEDGLFIRLTMPTADRQGLYQSYRAVSIPQPIPSTETATTYALTNDILLTTDERRVFVGMTMSNFVTQSPLSGRVRLCKRPFLWNKLTKDDCLTNLYLGREDAAIRTCHHTVVDLPKEVTAEYLEDSVYLVTARSDNYSFRNYSATSRKPVMVPGCRSCLIRPPCDGHIENYSGSMELRADWRSCGHGNGSIIHIQQPSLLTAILGELDQAEKRLLERPAAPHLKRDLQRRVMEASRLKLVTLPEEVVDNRRMKELAKPLAEEVVTGYVRHGPFRRSTAFAVLVTILTMTVMGLGVLAAAQFGLLTYLQKWCRDHLSKCRREDEQGQEMKPTPRGLKRGKKETLSQEDEDCQEEQCNEDQSSSQTGANQPDSPKTPTQGSGTSKRPMTPGEANAYGKKGGKCAKTTPETSI